MSISPVRVAELQSAQENRIHELEKKLGVHVLGLYSQPRQANLSEDQIERLRSIERELGVTLVAYERTTPLLSEEQYQHLQAVATELGLTLLPFDAARQNY
jgi:uncharacterized protein YbaP (TraB family)